MIELKDKRLEDKILTFCQTNNLDYDEYIEDKIRDGFNIDLYGDMNVMLYGKETPNKEVDNDFEKSCERVLKSMNVEGKNLYLEFDGEKPLEINLSDLFDYDIQSKEENVETNNKEENVLKQETIEEIKPKRRKRTIKSN